MCVIRKATKQAANQIILATIHKCSNALSTLCRRCCFLSMNITPNIQNIITHTHNHFKNQNKYIIGNDMCLYNSWAAPNHFTFYLYVLYNNIFKKVLTLACITSRCQNAIPQRNVFYIILLFSFFSILSYFATIHLVSVVWRGGGKSHSTLWRDHE